MSGDLEEFWEVVEPDEVTHHQKPDFRWVREHNTDRCCLTVKFEVDYTWMERASQSDLVKLMQIMAWLEQLGGSK